MNDTEKEKVVAEIAAEVNNCSASTKRERTTPFLEGETLTVAWPKSNDVKEILKHVTEEEAAKEGIHAWDYILLTDGRRLSTSQITRTANGLGLNGKIATDRLTNFLELLVERGTLQLKITKSAVVPSTNPAYNGTRVLKFDSLR